MNTEIMKKWVVGWIILSIVAIGSSLAGSKIVRELNDCKEMYQKSLTPHD